MYVPARHPWWPSRFLALLATVFALNTLEAQEPAATVIEVSATQLQELFIATQVDRGQSAEALSFATHQLLEAIVPIGPAWAAGAEVDPSIVGLYFEIATHLACLPDGPWTQRLNSVDPMSTCRALVRQTGGLELESAWVDSTVRELLAAGRVRRASKLLLDSLIPWEAEPRLLALANIRLADIARSLSDWDTAEQRLGLADKALSQAGDPADPRTSGLQCERLGSLGQVQLEFGLVDLAYTSFDQAGKIADRLGDRPDLVHETLIRRSDMMLLRQRHDELLRVVVPIVQDKSVDPGTRGKLAIRVGLAQAELERRRGIELGARKTLLDAMTAPVGDASLLAVDFMLTDLALRDRGFDVAEGHLARARDRLNRRKRIDSNGKEQPQPEVALLSAFEGKVARLRNDGVAALSIKLRNLREDFAVLVDSWNRMPVRPGGVGYLKVRRWRSVISELILLCIAVEEDGESAALSHFAEVQATATMARRLNVSAPTPAVIREWLADSRGGALIFVPGGEYSHLLVADAQDVTHHLLAPGHELVAAVRQLNQHVRRPPASPDRGPLRLAASSLADALIPAAERDRIESWEHIYFVADDLIGGVPAAALCLDDKEPLGLRKPISHVSSIPLATHLYLRSKGAAQDYGAELALLSSPVHHSSIKDRWPGLDSLSIDDEDLARLARPFDSSRTIVNTGTDATGPALGKMTRSGARILLLACHGAYAPTRERPAGLIVSPSGADDDGVLWCGDVEETVGRSQLAILAACAAARGPQRLGDDGVSHLGGAFVFNGALTVILARTELGLRSTLDLLTDCLGHIAAGDPPAHAMMKARRWMANQPGRDHPFFHSLLQVTGVGHVPIGIARGATANDNSTRSFNSWSWAAIPVALALLGYLALHVYSGRRDPSKGRTG